MDNDEQRDYEEERYNAETPIREGWADDELDVCDFVQDKLAAETDAYRRTLIAWPDSTVMTWDKGYMAGYIRAMEQVEAELLKTRVIS